MKPLTAAVPPLVALIAGTCWILYQRQSLATVEGESTVLRGYIETARHGSLASAADPRSADPRSGTPAGKSASKKIDWKKALAMQQAQSTMPDLRTMVEIQNQLTDMSAPELLAQLDQISAEGFAQDARQNLECMILGILVQKDPQAAMDHFIGEIDSPRLSWQLSAAFQTWAGKDSTAAAAWLDKQIEAGTLDSKTLDGLSQSRQQLESALLVTLLSQDPQQGQARLNALPENQRADILRNLFYQIKPGTEKAMAETIRTTLPASRQAGMLGEISSRLALKGLESIDSFLTDINPTAAERTEIVEKAFLSHLRVNSSDKPDEERLDAARAWATRQGMTTVDRSTGQSLGSGSMRGNFEINSEIVLKYQKQSGSDEVLLGFLSSPAAYQKPEEALKLVDKISDPSMREQERERLQAISAPKDN